mmetsp:Transcript_10819/g.15126  ORF Transcript_10819/g.15126 Transcript_10819/m.15126 type:complete len:149 (+) Transcript_10819:79-525(+)
MVDASATTLDTVFKTFSAGNKEMDGKQFVKLCKDTGLVDKKFTTTDVDLIFAKVKDKSVRKITFAQFENAVGQIATKKGVTKDDVSEKIIAAGGPKYEGTKADYNKFHDDKSTYTGVYAKGGPTNVDGSKDLSGVLDRTEADVRGVKK